MKNNTESKSVLYAEANYGDEEINAAINVLKNQKHNLVTSHNVEEFESRVSDIFNKKYGLMVNSGSSANLIAIKSLSLPKGGEVITPTLTFSTTVAPIVQSDLIPVFIDAELSTLQINIDLIEQCISENTVAIMVPNLIGNLPDWVKLREIADKNNLILIEDSADTIGYKYQGSFGNKYTDIVTTSFYASHIITGAGVGGMVCFNDEEVFNKAKSLRSWGRRSSQYGETEDINRRLKASIEDFDYDDKYIFDDLGYNCIPSEVSAAFALEQFKKLKNNIKIRRRNFDYFKDKLSGHNEEFLTFSDNQDVECNWLAFPICLQGKLEGKRKDLQFFMEGNGIQTRTIFTGNITRHPIMEGIPYINGSESYPVADKIMKNGLLLGCHNSLELEDIDYMSDNLISFLAKL